MNCEGDVVLIYYQDKPTMYARIEAIEPDIKKEWYRVTLLLLTVPSQIITWILREEYIDGSPFTMGGNSVMIKKVDRVSIKETSQSEERATQSKEEGKSSNVIPFKNSSK
jgi:hypothetical protein